MTIAIKLAVIISLCKIIFTLVYAEVIVSSSLFGTLSGSINKTAWTSKPIYQFLGVKYAESPSGNLRFKKPVLAIPWKGYHNVEKLSRRCPNWKFLQTLSQDELNEDLEDCLRLNIYTTNLTANFAVMVYVYGGHFDKLSDDLLEPVLLLEKNVVLVTIKYRVGALGFLSTETPEIPGNVALADIVASLKWVQICIRHFGGDPTRVTLIGHSSGAAMVSALVFNPATPLNLFHRSMILSGSSFSTWSFDDKPLEQARNIASFTNCTDIDSISGLNQCFLNISVVELMEAYNNNYLNHIKKCKIPCGGSKFVVNDILPLNPMDILRDFKTIKNIPLIMSVVTHDAVSILGTEIYSRLSDRFGIDNSTFNTHELIDFILSYAGINDYTGTIKGLLSHMLFTNNEIVNGNFKQMLPGIIDIANIILMKAPIFKSLHSQALLHPNQTYAYAIEYLGQYSYGTGYKYEYEPFIDGVQHGDELMYTFAQPDYLADFDERDKQFSNNLVELWTSFAIYGVPKSRDIPMWSPMKNFAGPYLILDEKSHINDNFLDELTHVTHQAHCNSGALNLFKNSSIHVMYFYFAVALIIILFKL